MPAIIGEALANFHMASVDQIESIAPDSSLIDHIVKCVWPPNESSLIVPKSDISVLHIRNHETAHFALDVKAACVAEKVCLPLDVPIIVQARIARHNVEGRAQAPLQAKAQVLGPIHLSQLVIGRDAWALKEQCALLDAMVVNSSGLASPSVVDWTLASIDWE